VIGCCGIECSSCPAFLATQADDDALRAEVAAKWSVQYQVEMKPEDINCVGCVGEGVHIGHCEHACTFRKCSMAKGHDNCAACDEYPCEQLAAFHAHVPDAGANLDALRE